MADLGVNSRYYAARPTLTVNGREEKGLREGLMTLAVEETTEGLYRCEATFSNWGLESGEVGFLYFDRQVIEFGRALVVEMGQGDTAAEIFSGRITAIEGRYPQSRPPELLILAEDRLQDLRMVRHSRSFENASDREVIEQIASQHGLATELDLDGPRYPLLAQVNQSDLAFLRERVRAIDAELWFENNTIHAQSRARRRHGNTVTLTYGQGMHEFCVTADLAWQRSRVAVSGWDVEAKEGLNEESDEAAIRAELNGSASGSRILDQSFGVRVDRLVHQAPLSAPEAKALADAHYRRMARRFVRGHAVAEGDGRIRVGSRVNLRGLGPVFDGEYYTAAVCHSFDMRNGFRTAFQVERPGLGGN